MNLEVLLLLSMQNLNFCGYLILRIFITCEISEIKSVAELVELSGFTVQYEEAKFCPLLFTLSYFLFFFLVDE